MKFESMKLTGFKSFRKTIEVSFPDGITAIVGPNGCGKSNIVDAMRWVLGEQSARSLRGDSMRDVIFGGSKSRRPMGMAEVTLLFSSNGGNGGPENIEVTRRLYRSGMSEYQLNRVNCRLKDIVQLFADTGVGRNSYAIIEQGKVDFLLKAKPLERRLLFESAAGIMGYKVRRHEAKIKLRRTKENLVRVSDIYDEVKRQRAALQRQVRRVRRYRALKSQLEDVRKHILGIRLVKAYSELAELGRAMVELEDREVSLRGDLSCSEAHLVEARHRFKELEIQLNELKARHAEHTAESVRLHTEIRSARQRIAQIEEENARDASELAQLNERIDSMAAERRGLEEQQVEYRNLVLDKELLCEAAEDRVVQAQQALEETDAALRKAKYNAVRVNDLLVKSTNALRELELHAQKLIISAERNLSEEDILEQELDRLQSELHSAAEQVMRVQDELEELKLIRHQANYEKTELEQERRSLKQENAELTERLVLERSKLTSLVELLERHEGFDEGLRRLLERLKGELEPGSFTLLADMLEVAPGVERAVEVALGRRLQDILVVDEDTALRCAEMIRREGLGRNTFIWPDSIDTAPPDAGRVPDAAAPPLLHSLTAPPGVRDHLSRWLAGWYLAGNSATARRLARTHRGAVFITTEGEAHGPGAMVTSGSQGDFGSGHLQRRTAVKGHQEAIGRLSGRDAVQKARLLDIETRWDVLNDRLVEIESQIRDVQLKEAELNRDRSHLAQEITRLENRKRSMAIEKNFIESELETIKSRRNKLQNEADHYTREVTRTEEAVKECDDRLRSGHIKKEEAQQLLNEERVMLARYREKTSSIGQDIQRLGAAVDEARNRAERGGQVMARRDEEARTLAGGVVQAEERLSGLEEMTHGIAGEIAGYEDEQGALGEALNMHEEAAGIARRALEKCLERLQEMRLENNKWSLERDHLEEQGGLSREAAEALVEEYRSKTAADIQELTGTIEPLNAQLAAIGEVNFTAEEEYGEIDERFTFLGTQQEDLQQSINEIEDVIERINATTDRLFKETFDSVNGHFRRIFSDLFQGGEAELQLCADAPVETEEHDREELTDEDREEGIEILAKPPGKKLQKLSLMSGGEKALTALALLFAMMAHRPAPFIILDEVDAPLDEVNITRFVQYLRMISGQTQIIVVTHHTTTMKAADLLYGVTMSEPGVSNLISVALTSDDRLQVASSSVAEV
ncbi:chromosome segregation protein SMC [bacterium]|nr:chromosome segregation protein SMC [candidate division CSSED10-310 bacterium]